MDRRYDHTLEICRKLSKCPGVHSVIAMQAAGFEYTNFRDTVRCNECQLEVSDWTKAMKPFTIHGERSLDCAFVRSIRSSNKSVSLSSCASPITSRNEINTESTSESTSETEVKLHPHMFAKPEVVEQSRHRTFSQETFSCPLCLERMIKAGFFSCNIDDRVICLDCNLICHQWVPHSDDPCEVHQTLSPECPTVKNMLIHSQTSSALIVNDNSTTNHTAGAVNTHTFHSNEIVLIAPPHSVYEYIPKRIESFATWPNGPLPTIDEFVRAGFFYTGNGSIVTCFYCRSSLHNWNANHDPMIEHVRWFPHCAYAKQLCGDALHRTIQESTRDAQRLTRTNNPTKSNTVDGQKLYIFDEEKLSHLVAARLKLPMSQKWLAQHFQLSIIKLCWENQLRLNHVDFESEGDLLVAYIVLQNQMIHIDKRKEHIIIPAEKMREIHERQQQQSGTRASVTSISAPVTALPTNALNTAEVGISVIPESSMDQQMSIELTPVTLCAVCRKEERCLAFIPCGHMGTCLSCAHLLKSCHICGRIIEAFVRIYI
ncbi:unnamed protein product [Rotaria sordida]|uniref:RING-type domain-containing protein n=1 Tax=Rotaria sordida TaxID=392033 RepID=A0A814X7A4_9BILA|nr:unnamed protein product [Rotaria sordida]